MEFFDHFSLSAYRVTYLRIFKQLLLTIVNGINSDPLKFIAVNLADSFLSFYGLIFVVEKKRSKYLIIFSSGEYEGCLLR